MRYKYFIDGNNLIHKIPALSIASKKNLYDTRINLALILDRYFIDKNVTCKVFFDGFAKDSVKTGKVRIYYSEAKSADELIRKEIENADNYKLISVVSSDNWISNLAKACGCKVIKSEEFGKLIIDNNHKSSDNLEKEIINKLNNENWTNIFLED